MKKKSTPKKWKTVLRARAIIRRGRRILLCQNIEHGHYYLPGGHIDPGELSTETVLRELREELKRPGTLHVGDFAGASERLYFDRRRGHDTYEMCLLFTVHAPGIGDEPKSRESYIRFEWHDIDDLAKLKVGPPELPRILADWKRFAYPRHNLSKEKVRRKK